MAQTLPYTQQGFAGGMNLLAQETLIRGDQIKLGVNVRSRFDSLECIREPQLYMDGLPGDVTNIQGLYAFGDIRVLFADGAAWYRTDTTNWTAVAGFAMDSSVSRYWACAVPAASLKYLRKAALTGSPTSGRLLEDSVVTGSPIALVVQDGINQPFLIFPDGSSREAHDYAAWTTADREYVPIGRQMIYTNGILFVVAPDGKSVYRSVSGRPIDFVVAVDSTGNKVADATEPSFAVDANEIKLIEKMNSSGGILIITAYAAYAVTLNFDNTIYAEPQFDQTFLFAAGTVNQFCLAEILGDLAFIDREGLKSFNAVSQLNVEGNNSVFSLSVAELFKGIIQDDPCVGSFDNYTFFSVKTTYSPASVLVFDNIKKVFVSLDILGIQAIKQFASTYSAAKQRFYAATRNKVYELYTDAGDYKSAVVFTRGFDSLNCDLGPTAGPANIKTASMRLVFEDGEVDGNLTVTELVNNRLQTKDYYLEIPAVSSEVLYPVRGPVMPTLTNSIVPIDIPFKGKEGQKTAYVLTWEGGARLSQFYLYAECEKSPTSIQQQTRIRD